MNRIRNIVIVATVILLIGGCLAVVFYLTGDRPDLYTFQHIRLAVAPEAPIDGFGHLNFMVGVDKNGYLDIHEAAVSKDQLAAILAARKEKRGEFPVLIGADVRTDFANVWGVVRICRAAGLPRTGFVAATSPDQQVLWSLDFMPPPEDMGIAEPSDEIRIFVSSSSLQLNGKAVEPQVLERQLLRVAAYSRRVPIRVTLGTSVKHEEVIRVLRLCAKSGLTDVAIERQEDAQQDASSIPRMARGRAIRVC